MMESDSDSETNGRSPPMKSPFPGMDPYLERHWGDVHHSVIQYIRDWLQSRLPSDLRARMEERVYIDLPDPKRAEYYPDVRVVERPRSSQAAGPTTAVAEPPTATETENGDLLPAKPLLIHLDIEPVTEGYVQIIDVKSGHRVVTAIELLSLANKRAGKGRRLYLKKREDQQSAGVNTVEIDLLRRGRRVLMVGAEQIPPSDRTTYQVCVWRGSRPNLVEVYRVPLRERLPVIPIPLRPADRDVPLDLQPILEQCYRNGGYDDIDYSAEPDPPLPTADAKWADVLLREHARR
jgi:Protein of unknown function (DUF4058)